MERRPSFFGDLDEVDGAPRRAVVEQRQSASAALLIFVGAVPKLAKAVEEGGAGGDLATMSSHFRGSVAAGCS